jgi:hypothetical protein
MTTKTKARENLRYLRQMIREAEAAITRGDLTDLSEILNEIDGTSAQLRVYAEGEDD